MLCSSVSQRQSSQVSPKFFHFKVNQKSRFPQLSKDVFDHVYYQPKYNTFGFFHWPGLRFPTFSLMSICKLIKCKLYRNSLATYSRNDIIGCTDILTCEHLNFS
ncbi:hypothetical protein ES288_D11G285500v1 [Gossypium darwinii]|uniref:Uncharacterized protein n=1 Tax=Gossypium darwinii TaxID=34276 RepID=A0A5D2AUA4_GOSDA|nr:hypothetical protein ES288_D11G285500v1 [Gossypium darwinii]